MYNTDGSLYSGFTFQFLDASIGGRIATFDEQSDGKIVVGGYFTGYGLTTGLKSIMRVNSNGTYDSSFTCTPLNGTSPADIVYLKVLSTGKIIIMGSFTSLNGVTKYGIARLNSDGSTDTSFNSGGAGFVSYVQPNYGYVQTDGKILMIGAIGSTYNGTSLKTGVIRFNSDGTLDTTFESNRTATDGNQRAITVDSIGNIYTTNSYSGVIRMLPNGTFDSSFTSLTFDNTTPVETIVTQSDGRITAVGYFTTCNSISSNGIIRLYQDGTSNTYPI
jgi:uncharacterized delta-60 repeat protein